MDAILELELPKLCKLTMTQRRDFVENCRLKTRKRSHFLLIAFLISINAAWLLLPITETTSSENVLRKE